MRILIPILVFLAALPAAAQQMPTPRRLPGEHGSDAAFLIARAAWVVQVVRAKRMIELDRRPFGRRASDLRVSVVVLDSGSATDLSPRYDIHLALFNDVQEHGLAWSVEPAARVFAFHGVQRRAPGIYAAEVTVPNPQADEQNCSFIRANIVIDARDLSVAVRRASGLAEFQIRRYSRPIRVAQEPLGCTRL